MGSNPSSVASSNISTAIGAQKGGVPANAANTSALQKASVGGSALQDYLASQSVGSNFTQYMGQPGAWIETTMQATGAPIFYAAQVGADQKAMTAVLQCQPISGVGSSDTSSSASSSASSDNSAPDQFQWNGQGYNVMGTMTMTISYDESPMWYFEAPVGVLEAYPFYLLSGNVLKGLMKPLLNSMVSGVRTLAQRITGGAANAGDAAADGAEAMAQDGVGVAGSDATVSIAAGAASLLGVGALVGIPILIDALGHQTTHTLQVYNLTGYNITWSVLTTPHGAMNESPTTGVDTGDANYVIPAMTSFTVIPGAAATDNYSSAMFAFASQSEYTGIAYVIQFVIADPTSGNTVDTITAMFDIPYTGDNSVSLTDQVQSDPEGWYSSQEGTNQVLSLTLKGSAVTATVNYNALDGECENPATGQNGYFYASQLVFTPMTQ